LVEVLPLTGPIDDDVDRICPYDRVTDAIGTGTRGRAYQPVGKRWLPGRADLVKPQAERVLCASKADRGPYALGVEIACP
jgi:dihydroneopterin aldolase